MHPFGGSRSVIIKCTSGRAVVKQSLSAASCCSCHAISPPPSNATSSAHPHSSSSSCFRGPGFYSSDCIPYSFTIYKLLTIGIVAQFAFQFAIIIFSDSQIERMKIKLRINYKGNKKTTPHIQGSPGSARTRTRVACAGGNGNGPSA